MICGKFGDGNFSRFGFIMQANRQTDVDDICTRATWAIMLCQYVHGILWHLGVSGLAPILSTLYTVANWNVTTEPLDSNNFCVKFARVLSPLTSTWPHLNSYVGLEEGGMLTELSLCYSIVYHFSNAHCTVIMSSSFRSAYWIGLDLIGPSSQSSKHLCIFGLCGAM